MLTSGRFSIPSTKRTMTFSHIMDLKAIYISFEPQTQPSPLKNDHQGEVLKRIQ